MMASRLLRRAVKHEYDRLDRPTRTTYPDGTTRETRWDKLDVSSVKERGGQVTHYRHDAARNLVSATDPARTIHLGYDAAGRLVSLTDGNGQRTAWQRDRQGRIIGKYTADSAKVFFSYDTAGRLASRTDAKGQTRHIAYGPDNRPVRLIYANAAVPTPDVLLEWDAHYPRLAAMTDGTGTARYRYGAVGEVGALALAQVEGASAQSGLALRRGAGGRVEAWSLAGEALEEYAFDALGRISSARSALLGQFDYGYIGDTGRLASATLRGAPLRHGYEYDPKSGLLREIAHPPGARSYAVAHGPDFTIKSIRESVGAESAESAESAGAEAAEWAYEYDAIGRLTQARRGTGQYRYGYDKGDNLILAETPENTQTFRPSPGNKLNQAHWRFDRAGNRIADDRHTYRWDAADRLVGIGYKGAPNRRTEFRYDGHGRLHAAIEWEGNKTMTKTFYTWCGNAICATRDDKGRPLARYFQGGLWRSGQGRAYYARDHLGSVRDVLDDKGRLLARHDYDPYGNLIGPGPGPDFGYAGMLRHAPSGLYLTRHRAYDPRSARWLSRDPIGEAGGINLYAYVGGNPVSFVDPLGLASCTYSITGGRLVCVPDNPANAPVDIPVASGNNGEGMQCKNNPNCISMPNRGPIPTGSWRWPTPQELEDTHQGTEKPNGRVLNPLPGTNTYGRDLFRTHSCINAFGPALGPQFCSEGCITGSAVNIQKLNILLDAEPGSILEVVP